MLFVNDESFAQLAYINQFEPHFEITTAENGLKAVNIVKEHPRDYFQIIILDINMPIMDGFEACDRIYEYLCSPEKLVHFRIS